MKVCSFFGTCSIALNSRKTRREGGGADDAAMSETRAAEPMEGPFREGVAAAVHACLLLLTRWLRLPGPASRLARFRRIPD
jgi:hypothetical protein